MQCSSGRYRFQTALSIVTVGFQVEKITIRVNDVTISNIENMEYKN